MRPFPSIRDVTVAGPVAFIVLLAIALPLVSRITAGVTVVVTNNTDADIKDLNIEYTGGVATTARLAPQDIWTTVVRPAGESHLVLAFTDSSGRDRRETIGVYFEPRYRGDVFIEVGPSGRVRHEDKTRLPGLVF